MDLALVLLLQVLSTVASLVLISLGLAVIFGMMRVINLAHGEFLMLGGYSAILAYNHGVPLWPAMLLVAPIVVGLIGLVVERLVIRPLYGRMIDTMLATWGLSLALIGIVTTLFGNTVSGISAPLGSVAIGAYRTSGYELFLIAAAIALTAAIWLVLRFTDLGLIARGTMQNPEMAASLGVDPSRVYALTFATGAAISGLAGALIAPLAGVVPDHGHGLHRQGLHHRDQRRCRHPGRHPLRRRPSRHRQYHRQLPHHPRPGRGRPPRHRPGPPPPLPPRHHRPVLPEGAVMLLVISPPTRSGAGVTITAGERAGADPRQSRPGR